MWKYELSTGCHDSIQAGTQRIKFSINTRQYYYIALPIA